MLFRSLCGCIAKQGISGAPDDARRYCRDVSNAGSAGILLPQALDGQQDTEDGQFFLHKLEKKVKAQATIINGDRNAEAFARKDYEFHRSMIQSLHNESMLAIYRNFMYRIFWLNVMSFKQPGRIDDTLTEHQQILKMVYDCDLEALAALLHDDTIFGMHKKIYRHSHSRDVQQCSRLTMPVLKIGRAHV